MDNNLDTAKEYQQWTRSVLECCNDITSRDKDPFIDKRGDGEYVVFTIDGLEFDCKLPEEYTKYRPRTFINDFLKEHYDQDACEK